MELANVKKLQAVIRNHMTIINILMDTDPSKAKNLYLNLINSRKVTLS